MHQHSSGEEPKDKDGYSLSKRINELNDKASQLLLFLSFAIVAAILLEANPKLTPHELAAVKWSLRFWIIGLFPVLLSVLPVKEIRFNRATWYRKIQTAKVVLLFAAVSLMILGAIALLCAIW